MEELIAIEEELEEIINDISKQPNYFNEYDLVRLMKEIKNKYIMLIEQIKYINIDKLNSLVELQAKLSDNNEYQTLSKKNCFYFNIIKNNLPSKYLEYLFEYEDTHSQIEEVILRLVEPLSVTNK